MAVSRGTSNGSDWMDVAMLILAFEGINTVRLETRISVVDRGGGAEVLVRVEAWTRVPEGTAPTLLAFVSSTCSALNRRTLEDALSLLLYRLDAEMAAGEFAKVLSK